MEEVGETHKGMQGVEVGFIGIVGETTRAMRHVRGRERERRGGGHVAVKCWVIVGGVHGPRVPMEIAKTTTGFPYLETRDTRQVDGLITTPFSLSILLY